MVVAEGGHSVEVEEHQMDVVEVLSEYTQAGTLGAMEEEVAGAAYLVVLGSNSRRREESYCSHGLLPKQTHPDKHNPWPFP